MRTRAATDVDTQPLTIPAELRARPVEVPHDWVVTPPRVTLLDRLLPLVMLVCGYTAALAASSAHQTLAWTLLFVVFVCLPRLGYAAIRYRRHSLRYRRSGASR